MKPSWAFENVGVPPASRLRPMLVHGIFPLVPSSCSDTIGAQWLQARQFRGSRGGWGLKCRRALDHAT